MRGKAHIWVAAAALAFLGASPALAVDAQPRLTKLAGAHFPQRSFVLTLPHKKALLTRMVTVRENRSSVSNLSVVPAQALGQKALGVVLVIDASNSMRGHAIEDAVGAGREFARQRNPRQQIGVVAFNRTARVALPLTAEESAIDAAFTTPPPLDDGTHVYDAVGTAVTMLERAKIKAGSVVVLSDGADTESRLGASDVAARAQAAGVRVFTVGLRSKSFDRRSLEGLATAGNGDYSEARSSTGLRPIYAALGTRLANEYVIRYRSLSKLGETVHVSLTAPGLEAASDYVAPAAVTARAQPAAKSSFWTSGIVLVAVSALCALMIGLAVAFVLASRPRRRSLQQRVQGFVPVATKSDPSGHVTTSKVLAEAEKSLARHQWWEQFKEEVEIARIRMPAVRLLAITAVGTLLGMWILTAASGSALAGLIALGIPFAVRSFVARKASKQRQLFDEQLAENLQVIASAMRAGHSFVGALTVAVEDAPEPARSELQRAVTDEKLGLPLDETLGLVAKRMRCSDLEQVVLVAVLQRETGGNTAEVVDRVAETIRERNELRRTVRTLTAQGRLARWVVTFLPASLLAIISVLNPDYMQPLFTTGTGNVLLVLGTVMVIFGSLVIKRIVDIKV